MAGQGTEGAGGAEEPQQQEEDAVVRRGDEEERHGRDGDKTRRLNKVN
jgi:hypothetical protein